MHESVPLSTKCRYLLWSVYNTIRNISSGIETFLTLLSKLPVGRKLACDYYKKQHWYGSIAVIIWDYSKIIWDYSEDEICKMLKEMFCQTDKGDHSNTSIIQSQPIYVNERDEPFKILLEVKIAAPQLIGMPCIWTKNNETLNDNFGPLLCVHIADVTAEGTYNFYVNYTEYSQQNFTIHVNSSIQKYSSVCVERYKGDNLAKADKDAWPQVSQNTYINLAVIDPQAEQELNTYIYKTIRGDADDIYKAKGEINYTDAFEGIKHGEVIIVEGRPGSGKTTLVYKISKDWANSVSKNAQKPPEQQCLGWRHVKALYVISLRGFCGNPNIELVDLVKCYYSNKQTIEIICDYITLKEGAGICFILDGLDEYQPANQDNFIFKLIEKKILAKAIIIVASRPAAVAKYRSAKKHFEVLGFYKEQIFEYIDTYNFSNDHLNSNCMLKQYMKERPYVYQMCYLPIQLAMVCFLYDKMKGTLPETETAIYAEFTKHTILRSLYRMPENSIDYIESIFSLPKPENEIFCSICTLAFEKTISSKQVLEQSEVDRYCEKINTSFGLVTIDRASTKCGFQKLYTFCHLTLQEFLAACHIYMRATKEYQLELVEISKKEKHMTVVLKFLCGLVDFGQDGVLFKNVINSEHFNFLTKIQCAFESQQTVTCNFIVLDNSSLNMEEAFLSTRDWTALSFFFIHADLNCVKKVCLKTSTISKEGLDAFVKQTKESSECFKVECVCFSGQINILLVNFMHMFSQLRIISTQVNTSTNDMLNKFQNSSLKVLHFQENQRLKLIVKLDFPTILKNIFLSSFKTLNTTSCFSSLVDIILDCIEKQSDFFVKELREICSAMCSLNSFVKMSLSDIDSDKATMVAESISFNGIEEEISYITDRLNEKSKPDSLLYYSDFISVGNLIIGLCFEIMKSANYYKLWILPQSASSFIKNLYLIKKSVLRVNNAYLDNVQLILKQSFLQIHLISQQNKKLDTISIYNVNHQISALSDSVSLFQLTSNVRNISCYINIRCDLMSLQDAISSCTELHSIATFKKGSSVISKILESFDFCDLLTQESESCINQAKDFVEVEQMTVSGTDKMLNYHLTCTPALLKLNYSIRESFCALSYFNRYNLNVIQLQLKYDMKLLVKLEFKKMVSNFFLSPLQSFNIINHKDSASILSHIILSCLDAQRDDIVDELTEKCCAMCTSNSSVRISLVQQCISDEIYMICESLSNEDVAREIELFTATNLYGKNLISNSLLHYTDFIQIKDHSIALLVDVTDAATDFKIYIVPEDDISRTKSHTNNLRFDSSIIPEVKNFLQANLLSVQNRKLNTVSIDKVELQTSALSWFVSQFQIASKNVIGHSKLRHDLMSLHDAITSCTQLCNTATFKDGSSVISKILKSFDFCDILAQDSLKESESCIDQAKDYIEVDHMTICGSSNMLNYNLTCTPSLLKLNYSTGLGPLIYFNRYNFDVIQFQIKDNKKLIARFVFKNLIQSLMSSFPSFNTVNPKTCASILSDLVLNCLNTQRNDFANELTELCSAMCPFNSRVRLSLVQQCISDEIYMICESLNKYDLKKEITANLYGDNFTKNSLLHYTDFIPIEDYRIAILVDVTEAATDFKIYIVHKDDVSHVKSNTNNLRLDSSFIPEVQKFLELLFQKGPYSAGGQKNLNLCVSNYRNMANPISGIILHISYYLKHLEFDSSTIVEEDLHALCQALNLCTNLNSISITGDYENVLFDLIASLRSETLSQICLKKCNINTELFEIVSPIWCHFNLLVFHLTNDEIGSFSLAKSLGQLFKGWKYLQELCLSHCHLTSPLLSILIEGIKECHHLHTLDLSHNNFGSKGCIQLSETLCYQSKSDTFQLCNLNLSYCSIEDDGTLSLANLIKKLSTNLLVFDISGNTLSREGAGNLAKALQSCFNLIELGFELPMPHSTILIDSYSLLFFFLKTVFKITCKLQKVLLSNLQMNYKQFKEFVEVVGTQKHLETFKLSNCSIGENTDDYYIREDYFKSLDFNFVWHKTNFKSLDFSHNVYSNEGFNTLCRSLWSCKYLCYLNLSGTSNMLNSDEPLQFEILDLPSSIEVIYLDNTNLSAGVYGIAEVISKCHKLRVLGMCNCNLGDIGATKIANGVKKILNLRKLDLQHNFISEDTISSITEILSKCHSLNILA